MGRFNFPCDFTHLYLINSPVQCEQVKSKVVFDYAVLDLQNGGNGMSLCWTKGGCIFVKIVLAQLNWTVF